MIQNKSMDNIQQQSDHTNPLTALFLRKYPDFGGFVGQKVKTSYKLAESPSKQALVTVWDAIKKEYTWLQQQKLYSTEIL